MLLHTFAYFLKKVYTSIYLYILFHQNEKKYVPVHTGTYRYILFDPFSYHGTGFQMYGAYRDPAECILLTRTVEFRS